MVDKFFYPHQTMKIAYDKRNAAHITYISDTK